MVAVFVLGAAAVGTVVINVRKSHASRGRNTASMFDAEARRAASEARVDGVKAMLEEMAAKARSAEERLENAIREKNAIERVLEEMERAKANMRVENAELRDSVTVLKSDLRDATARHQMVVRKWRDELVTYREKSPQDFLAEVIGLVADMDNEVTIEVIPPEAPRETKKHEEVHLEECEWEYNPRLAVMDSTRLLMLANSGRSVTATRNERFKKVTNVKRVSSPHRATTPTRMALSKLTNASAQRAVNAAHKAASLVQANREPSTPTLKINADRSVEFGECFVFEKTINSPTAPKLVGPRSPAITAFDADDFPSTPSGSKALAIVR